MRFKFIFLALLSASTVIALPSAHATTALPFPLFFPTYTAGLTVHEMGLSNGSECPAALSIYIVDSCLAYLLAIGFGDDIGTASTIGVLSLIRCLSIRGFCAHCYSFRLRAVRYPYRRPFRLTHCLEGVTGEPVDLFPRNALLLRCYTNIY